MCFWCNLKYTHAINLIFGYVAVYSMYRLVTKVGMILMCRFRVMNYVSFMLD
jgi:hypothetical protein